MNAEPAVVRHARHVLSAVVWVQAVLFGTVAGIASWLALQLVLAVAAMSASGLAIGIGLASAIALVAFMRKRVGTISSTRTALWLEEQIPELQYALVTLADTGADRLSDEARLRLTRKVGTPETQPHLTRAALRTLWKPVLLAVALVAAAMPLQRRLISFGSRTGNTTPGSTGVKARPPKPGGNALANWNVRVVPPTYSKLPSRALGDAGTVNALVGSRIEVTGRDRQLPNATIRTIQDSILPSPAIVVTADSTWSAALSMPAIASELRFTLGASARQLLLEPRADSLPVVRLTLPVRDSVLRSATGSLQLEADAHDDLGLSTTAFELIVSSGEGERFTARSVAITPQRLANDTDHQWRALVVLDTMHLEEGDIVHLRAVARDQHPDATRGSGASETRTLRVARAREYDSVSVEAAPPPEVDKSLMSQRMLLILTEKLEQRRPQLKRSVLVEESRKMAADQARLRKAVGDLVFQRLTGEEGAEHSDAKPNGVTLVQGKLVIAQDTSGPPVLDFEGDESPVVAINRPLLEAYNAMWDAAGALDIADPKGAIPHMRAALAAIQRARSAERIYLRGKPPVIIVDIAKVRLAGKDTGQKNARTSRDALSVRDAARETRLLNASLLFAHNALAARDSLAVLRLESLADAPRLASALSDVLDVAQRGGDLTSALIRARRAIGQGAVSDSLSVWRGRQ